MSEEKTVEEKTVKVKFLHNATYRNVNYGPEFEPFAEVTPEWAKIFVENNLVERVEEPKEFDVTPEAPQPEEKAKKK